MTRIALAGGSGAVGKTFLQELSKTNHSIIVLTRSSSSSSSTTINPSPDPRITYVQTTYDIPALTDLLITHKIDTVISTITMISQASSDAQLNLIQAAEASPLTTRFIPSEYGVLATEEVAAVDPFGRFLLENAQALERTKTLEYTRLIVGSFMDFWGAPSLNSEINADFKWVFDVPARKARIPGTGEEVVSVTFSRDIARAVARLVGEEKGSWEKVVGLVGQDIKFGEVLRWLESEVGEFDVVWGDEVGGLNEAEELREIERAFAKMVVEGIMNIKGLEGGMLNERWEGMEMLTLERMISETWGKAGKRDEE